MTDDLHIWLKFDVIIKNSDRLTKRPITRYCWNELRGKKPRSPFSTGHCSPPVTGDNFSLWIKNNDKNCSVHWAKGTIASALFHHWTLSFSMVFASILEGENRPVNSVKSKSLDPHAGKTLGRTATYTVHPQPSFTMTAFAQKKRIGLIRCLRIREFDGWNVHLDKCFANGKKTRDTISSWKGKEEKGGREIEHDKRRMETAYTRNRGKSLGLSRRRVALEKKTYCAGFCWNLTLSSH